jgi:hypothetical protein
MNMHGRLLKPCSDTIDGAVRIELLKEFIAQHGAEEFDGFSDA